jgi:predicted ArsR family transcriptional regulator
MTEDEPVSHSVDQFLRDQIDTVPHLEALLLLWNSRPKLWSTEEMAKGLFIAFETAKEILDDLVRQRLIAVEAVPGASETYRYEPEVNRDELVAAVDSTYRRELIRVSRLIHSKPSAAIREFARAFRLKKEGE